MVRYQSFVEVYLSLKAHKIRTIFTGFGVMWAMLILVLLQGGGRGFYNGMMKRFQHYGSHIMQIDPGYTSIGKVYFTEALADNLAHHLSLFKQSMPIFCKHRCAIAYEQAIYKSSLLGVRIGYETLSHLALEEGRFFTQRDLEQTHPVCILGSKMKTQLFGTHPAIGQSITIDGTAVDVIGVLEATAGRNDAKIMITSALFKVLFPKKAETVDYIMATLLPKQNVIKIEEKIRAYLARQLNWGEQDQQACYISSPSKRMMAFQILFIVMQGFIWLVSLCFLVSGVVSVGNMMLVVVKERTQELAIRKVMGAKPSDIVGLILLESIVINFISGILGLGIGIAIIQWINSHLRSIIEQHGMGHFEFQYAVALSALVVLVLSGCLAGMIPAKRAWSIKPVDALNNE